MISSDDSHILDADVSPPECLNDSLLLTSNSGFLAPFFLILGTYKPSSMPHLLWVTEFPLFTRADSDKEFLAHGRWSSSHHPFTAPMREDVEKLYDGDIANVRLDF